jgi:putative flippase GtrA
MNPLGIEVSRFAVVGIINTLIDLIFFNVFRRTLKVKAIVASYLSSTIAMINSYVLNKYWTFSGGGNSSQGEEAVKFLFSTIIGVYGIHNGIVWLLSEKILWPGNFIYAITSRIPVIKKLSSQFIHDNFAKGCGILGSLIWNFLLYKFWVFK